MANTLTQAIVNLYNSVGYIENGVNTVEDKLIKISENEKVALLKDIYLNSTVTRIDDDGNISNGILFNHQRVLQVKNNK